MQQYHTIYEVLVLPNTRVDIIYILYTVDCAVIWLVNILMKIVFKLLYTMIIFKGCKLPGFHSEFLYVVQILVFSKVSDSRSNIQLESYVYIK